MRTKTSFLLACAGLCALSGVFLSGCQQDSAVSKQDEEKLRNPSKGMPKEAQDYMRTHSGGPPAGAK